MDDLSGILSSLRAYGGYFRRFKIPPAFVGYVDESGRPLPNVSSTDLSLDQRLTLAFLDADVQCLKTRRLNDPEKNNEGSTGSIAIIEPHDAQSFWDSESYDIIVGHVGDTR